MTDLAAVEAELAAAIGEVLTRNGMYPNRWMLLAEIVEAEGEEAGERANTSFASPGLTAWDSYGLLTHAMTREKAEQIRSVLDG